MGWDISVDVGGIVSGFTSSTSNTRLLQAIVDQLRRDAERADDTQERIQQQLAKINEDENLEPTKRHYGNA